MLDSVPGGMHASVHGRREGGGWDERGKRGLAKYIHTVCHWPCGSMSVQAASLSQARSWLLAARERSRRCLDSCKHTEARGRVSEQPHSEARVATGASTGTAASTNPGPCPCPGPRMASMPDMLASVPGMLRPLFRVGIRKAGGG